MERRYSSEVRDAIVHAKAEAFNSGSQRIEVRDLVLGLSSIPGDPCSALMADHGFNATLVRDQTRTGEPIRTGNIAVMSNEAEALLKDSTYIAFLHADSVVRPYHVLLTFLGTTKKHTLLEHLHERGMPYDVVLNELHAQDETLRKRYRSWAAKRWIRRVLLNTMVGRAVIWVW
jgi:ATP-dependent Clp protease ATP-binding subunit ClpA